MDKNPVGRALLLYKKIKYVRNERNHRDHVSHPFHFTDKETKDFFSKKNLMLFLEDDKLFY